MKMQNTLDGLVDQHVLVELGEVKIAGRIVGRSPEWLVMETPIGEKAYVQISKILLIVEIEGDAEAMRINGNI